MFSPGGGELAGEDRGLPLDSARLGSKELSKGLEVSREALEQELRSLRGDHQKLEMLGSALR